ncbi:MAG: hypothetical protein WC071_13885 [Victivallaceae bacterium]
MKCGVPTSSHATTVIIHDATIRALLPVGRSANAIAAGYLGLISALLIPICGIALFFGHPGWNLLLHNLWMLSLLMLPAPLAFLFGILAIFDMRVNPEKHGMGRAVFAIICGALFTVVGVAIAIVVVYESTGIGK